MNTAPDRARRALPTIIMVIGLHALVLFIFTSSGIVRWKTPQTVMQLAFVPPEIAEPAPPPLLYKAPRRPREAAAPPRNIEVAPRTDVLPTIVDNAKPVEVAGGKSEGSAGVGNVGEGVGGGGPVKVRAVINPDNCARPKLPWSAEERELAGDVILAILIDTDGKVTDARVARSSGQHLLDQAALRGARTCHFVAATVDQVPVASWEAFRFSWVNH